MSKNTNILLLALSTFQNKDENQVYHLKESSFKYKDENDIEDRTIKGIYQLDPVPPLVKEYLEKDGETIDCVIMLCTDAVRKKKKIMINEVKREEEVSPLEFFKEQLMKNCGLSSVVFKDISIQEDNPAQGIRETVTYIRNQKKPRILVDTHGGFRSVQLILEAILSLLKEDESIWIDRYYGIRHGGGNDRITNEDKTMDIFDFVSAMNAFFHYGRSQDLERCLKLDGDKEMLRAISTISEGIQLCDVYMFEKGLKDMDAYYQSEKESPHEYLKLFEDTMKSDYDSPRGEEHSLLHEKHTVTDEIRWAVRKGFYQQAITFVEARMPEEIFKYGLLVMAEGSDKHFDDKNENPRTYALNTIRNLFEQEEGTEERLDIVRQLNRRNYLRSTNGKQARYKMNRLYFPSQTSKHKKGNHDVPDAVSLYCGVADSVKLYAFLRLHHGIKKVRNHYNHCSPENSGISRKKIEDALELYCVMFDELVEGERVRPANKRAGNTANHCGTSLGNLIPKLS